MDKYDLKALDETMRTPRRSFYENDFKELDKNLAGEQRKEWNAIYASFQSRSILHGTVIGIDEVTMPTKDEESGEETSRSMPCLVVVQYRVKVIIPAPLVWTDDQEHSDRLLAGMVGAPVDYIIAAVDREGECAVASRRAAAEQQRWHALNVRHLKVGEVIPCTVMAVGPSRLTLSAHGYDAEVAQAGLSYSFLGDLRETYRPGQTLSARVLSISNDALSLSVRDAEPNPYEGAEIRHPVGSTRMATITGKYAGGVFCRLPDGCTVVCKYAQQFTDDQFSIGCKVLVQIREFSNDRQWLRAKIRSKVG